MRVRKYWEYQKKGILFNRKKTFVETKANTNIQKTQAITRKISCSFLLHFMYAEGQTHKHHLYERTNKQILDFIV